VDRGTPFEFPGGKGRVIKGWDEGVISMKVGGKPENDHPRRTWVGDRGGAGPSRRARPSYRVELLGSDLSHSHFTRVEEEVMKRLIAEFVAVLVSTGMLAAPTVGPRPQDRAVAGQDRQQAPPPRPTRWRTSRWIQTRAAKADLKMIPGIGDAYAKTMSRTVPYKRKDELAAEEGAAQGTTTRYKDTSSPS